MIGNSNELPQTQTTSSECPDCFDSGFYIVEGKGAKPCACRLAMAEERQLAKIPERFRSLRLETMKPDPSLHLKQQVALEALRGDPESSWILAGDFRTGKSAFMWALYAAAVERRTHTVACTLTELLDEYKVTFTDPEKKPRLTSVELRQGTRYSIFLDDIDKARPTEYTAEQFFDLVNTVYEHKHQLVVTTNLSTDELQKHFDRADLRFGGAIVRRLVDSSKMITLF